MVGDDKVQGAFFRIFDRLPIDDAGGLKGSIGIFGLLLFFFISISIRSWANSPAGNKKTRENRNLISFFITDILIMN